MANTEKVLERILAADKLAASPPEQQAPETPLVDCDCAHHKERHAAGYALGIQHATEEFQTRPPVATPAAPPMHVMTVDEVLQGFEQWQRAHGHYYVWEVDTMQALREALVHGDKVFGLFAYTAIIEHADGRRVEFQRKPNKGKK
jgi:hypothetical protein